MPLRKKTVRTAKKRTTRPVKRKAKKPSKKFTKKATRKPARKVAQRTAQKASGRTSEKPIGKVTHFFGKISVAIVKFSKPVRVGATVRFVGMHTEFTQVIASMQYDHKPIMIAKKGKEVGIKVKKDVHEGNLVYAA